MIATNPISELLSATLDPDWTIEGLVEQLLDAIVVLPPDEELVFFVDDSTDRQSRRLIRPLLAFLAMKSAEETGVPVNLYGGPLSIQRPSPTGPVWILGEFENRLGNVRVALHRSTSPAVSQQRDSRDPLPASHPLPLEV